MLPLVLLLLLNGLCACGRHRKQQRAKCDYTTSLILCQFVPNKNPGAIVWVRINTVAYGVIVFVAIEHMCIVFMEGKRATDQTHGTTCDRVGCVFICAQRFTIYVWLLFDSVSTMFGWVCVLCMLNDECFCIHDTSSEYAFVV